MPMDAETLSLTLDSIREFAKTGLPDELLLDFDARDHFPEDIVRAMSSDELGIQLVFIPEDFGGMGGGAFDVYRVCEAMAEIDLGLATGVLATFLGSDPIVFGGTEAQRSHWLTRIADEGLLMAYAATEPQAGSDLAAMATTATPVDGGYRITGNKQWISNGGFADAYSVLARAPGGPSWFIVDGDADGFDKGKPEDKHGIRLSNTAALSLEDVFVDASRLVGGEEGQGLQQAQMVFGFTRLMVAAFGLGAGWAALRRAMQYSTERIQAGAPLSDKQGYTHKLIVPHAVALEAGRAFIEETADRIDRGEGSLNTEGAIAKLLATEAGNVAADAAIQAHGGYGYTKEYMVEKIRRDVRITTIYEGTSEIMEMTIARDRWQAHLKSRGQHYHERAEQMQALHGQHPRCGADVGARALHALAELLERARAGRLTRSQHVLFRIGELVAHAEGAAALCRRAARCEAGELGDKADRTFDAPTLAAIARIFARQVAQKVAVDGVRWIVGAYESEDVDAGALERAVGLQEIRRAQVGLIHDMDRVADALYDRTQTAD